MMRLLCLCSLLLAVSCGDRSGRRFPLPVDESRSMLSRWATKEVLEWTLGRNPISSSLMYGVGYNFAPNFVYCTRNIAGALPVGMDSFHDDRPFWNGTAHATAHEIWIEPVSRFLGTLSVYLKNKSYEL